MEENHKREDEVFSLSFLGGFDIRPPRRPQLISIMFFMTIVARILLREF